MIIRKKVWPMPEHYEAQPRHEKKKKKCWEVLQKFLNEFYPNKKVKYEYAIYDEYWKDSIPEWQLCCALRIDCVIEISSEMSDIIETDPVLSEETFGQLLIYKDNYEKQSGKKVRKAIGLCLRNTNIINQAMKKYGLYTCIYAEDKFIFL